MLVLANNDRAYACDTAQAAEAWRRRVSQHCLAAVLMWVVGRRERQSGRVRATEGAEGPTMYQSTRNSNAVRMVQSVVLYEVGLRICQRKNVRW